MSIPFRRITLHLPCTVPWYAVQQNFFCTSPREKLQPSNFSIGTKLAVKVVFCTILVVIMSIPFRRITLHLPCTVPCYAVQQIFFFCVSKGNTPTIKSLIWNEVSCESGNLHNHFTDNVEPISKDNSAFTLHCPLLRGPTDFFLLRLQGKTPIIKSLIWNKVSCESGILHNHCSDNVEPISKNNCAFALQCPLLRGPTEFFFVRLQGENSSHQISQLERS